ncbi:MAG: hypothetical protein JOZ52_02245 [Acidobacteria bacterium]|nr:hypothetical protein [Acidobacteriota bacterium]
MAVKKRRARHKHYTGNKRGDTKELSARLAPLEERDGQKHEDEGGAIVLDTGKLKLPKALLEEEEDTSRIFGLEPVILVILLLALCFIGFIAYLIHQK